MKDKMKTILLTLSIVFTAVLTTRAQDIEVIVHETFLTDTIGSEMVFDFEIVNISNQVQTVFEVRTINDLPDNWQSSLCFGQNCFAPQIDSIATTQDFGTPPLNPGDTLITSLHVFPLVNNGTAYVQIQVGTFHNPDNRITLDFTATTEPVSVNDDASVPQEYFLAQNYPNPFNPSTKIRFQIPPFSKGVSERSGDGGLTTLKVYDILGNEISTLVNEVKSAGTYEVEFNGSSLSSGIYLYRLTTRNFTETRKMILEK